MQRLSCAILLIALIGCSREPQTIRVGDPSDRVHKVLEHSAEDISFAVGVQVSRPHRSKWYILQDGTCLQVVNSPGDDSIERVSSLILGDTGAGYGDKFKWLAQAHRDVMQLTIP